MTYILKILLVILVNTELVSISIDTVDVRLLRKPKIPPKILVIKMFVTLTIFF